VKSIISTKRKYCIIVCATRSGVNSGNLCGSGRNDSLQHEVYAEIYEIDTLYDHWILTFSFSWGWPSAFRLPNWRHWQLVQQAIGFTYWKLISETGLYILLKLVQFTLNKY